jgi:hypothetical protein
MFEADPLNGVREFDIDTQIVRVQLQLVAFGHGLVFLNVHGKPGHVTIE